MKVAMLAAVGYRLGKSEDAPPKALLPFADQTPLRRLLPWDIFWECRRLPAGRPAG